MGEGLSARNAAWSAAGGVIMLAGITSAPLLWPDFKHSVWELTLAIVATLAIPFGLYWMIAALKRWWPFATGTEPLAESGVVDPPPVEVDPPHRKPVIPPVSDEDFRSNIRGNKQT